MHDDVNCAKDVSDETEVPVGPGVGKLIGPDDLQDKESGRGCAHENEDDPVLDR